MPEKELIYPKLVTKGNNLSCLSVQTLPQWDVSFYRIILTPKLKRSDRIKRELMYFAILEEQI